MAQPILRTIDTPGVFEDALSLLRSGEIVALPTETVYGLAADATREDAVAKIFLAKGRPQDNPLICHVQSVAMAARYAPIPSIMHTLAEAFWPGPLTLIVREGEGIAPSVRAGTGKIGFRMPRHETMLGLIGALDKPLAAPSANRSGRPSGTRASHIAEDFTGTSLRLIVDGGPTSLGVESTIVDLTPLEEGGEALLVREGAISLEELAPFLPIRLVETLEAGMTISPGLTHKHYAPKGRLVLLEGTLAEQKAQLRFAKGGKVVCILASEIVGEAGNMPVLDGGPWAHPEVAAQRFFHLLREADAMGAEQIYCSTWSKTSGLGRALFERQRRAAG